MVFTHGMGGVKQLLPPLLFLFVRMDWLACFGSALAFFVLWVLPFG
jgi:hypothetical protein